MWVKASIMYAKVSVGVLKIRESVVSLRSFEQLGSIIARIDCLERTEKSLHTIEYHWLFLRRTCFGD